MKDSDIATELIGKSRVSVGGRYIEKLLASVLLAAASLKAYQFFIGAAGPVVPSLIHHGAILIILIDAEFILAVWLLVGGAPRARFACASICFTLFATFSGYEALRAVPSCGCFGNVKVSPMVTMGFDVSGVIGLWLSRPMKNILLPQSPSRLRIIGGGSFLVVVSVIIWAAYFVKQHNGVASGPANRVGDLIVLVPANWLTKPFPLIDEIDGGERLRTGRWIIVLYHYDCDDCLKAITTYRALAQNSVAGGDGPDIAFVAMPPIASSADDPVRPSSAYLRLTLRPNYDWFATTPVVAALEDGYVLAAFEGEQAIHPLNIAKWQKFKK